MKPSPTPLLHVPFSEVRHEEPDDCLHYEPVAVRGSEMNWTIPAHRHESLYQFQLIEQGAVQGTVDGRAFEARAPVLLMLAPGSVHGFTYTRHAVGHQVTLPSRTLRKLLDGSSLAASALGASFVLGEPRAEDAAACAGLFAQVAEEFRARQPGRVHALLALATLLAVQFVRLRDGQSAREQSAGARDALVRRYQALVEQHYGEHRPLVFYADLLAVTPDHLSRSCRNTMGQSAQQLLHERLLLEARRLLAYTEMPVAEVATQLGYADAAYFSKFFNRSLGHSPSAYRALMARGVRGA
jgi:AraC family transcriptional activator of pobA